MTIKFQFFKKRFFILSPLLLVLGYSVSSYSNGPMGTVLSCSRSSCHNFIPDKTSLNFSMKEKLSGLNVSDGFYKPNTEYIVELKGINTDSLEYFGFQTIITPSTGITSGTLIDISPKTSITLISGNATIAHNTAIEGIKKGFFEISFEWKSPNAGAGNINFNSILNAVNMDESASGDQPSEISSIILSEKVDLKIPTNTTFETISIYPNPCNKLLNIKTVSTTNFISTVYDVTSRLVIAPSHQSSIDVSNLTNGLYILQLISEKGEQTTTFIKQ